MNKKIIVLGTLIILGASSFLFYYFYFQKDLLIKEKTPPVEKIEKVSLRLKWLDQAQFAGYYLADKEGFYLEEGLNVEIFPGGPDISPLQMVAIGVNDFGITGADQIILAQEKGVPIIGIAVIYKQSPVSIISLKEKGIEEPKDLEGKTVAVVYGRDEETIYRTLLNKTGVNEEKIKEVPASPNATQLISGNVDALLGYKTNEGVLLEERGWEVNYIDPADYMVDFYADTIFTTQEMIEKNPHIVRGFIQATLRGWEMSLQNPEKALEAVLEKNSTLAKGHQERFLRESNPMIAKKGENLGEWSFEILKRMEEILISQGLLKKEVDLDRAFTKEFLQK